MEVTDRFADLVGRTTFPLDEAALLIAAHGDPACDIARALVQLDELAGVVAAPHLDDLLDAVFGRAGFHGDQTAYHDPRNSYLHTVLDRRRGIPITLSVVLMEVGRRIGVPLAGISAPAHFLTATIDGRYVDAFAAGQVLDRRDLDARFEVLAPGVVLDPFLVPASGHDIIRRILGNLVGVHQRRNDRVGMRWASELRTLVPGATSDDRRTYAGALAACGQFDRAARVLEALVESGGALDPDHELTAARRLRARLN